MKKLIFILSFCVFVYNINAQKISKVSQSWESEHRLTEKQLKSILSLKVDYMNDDLRAGKFKNANGKVLKNISLMLTIKGEGEKKYKNIEVLTKKNHIIWIRCDNCLVKNKKNDTYP